MASNSHSVVVWCFSPARRKPLMFVFDTKISNRIEGNYSSFTNAPQPNNNQRFPVDLKKSSKWADYEIDFQKFTMENKTGDSHPIVRQVCNPQSVFSQGYEWVVQGNGSGQWLTYDFDSTHVLEDAVSAKHPPSFPLDLSKVTSSLPYIIEMKGKILTQTNIHTGKKRKVKRRKLPVPYTPVPISSPPYRGNPMNGALQQRGAVAAHMTKKRKTDLKSGTNLQKPSSSLSISAPSNLSASQSDLLSSRPLSQSLSSIEFEKVTEPLPERRSIKISRDEKAEDKKSASKIEKYLTAVTDASDMDDEDCIICMEELSDESGFGEGSDQGKDVVKLATCGHTFHKLCVLAMYKNDHKEDGLECPSCKTIYGEKCGNCPPGEMLWEIQRGFSIPGYEGYDVIRLIYSISPGIQGPGDPNPGSRYRAFGFPREGYLPDCNKGRKVLKLLIEAFKRKLMFTIGTSVTTGQTDTVTWNEIHLKTEATSNISGHGYPDPLYLDNVLMELASHGVRDEGDDVSSFASASASASD